MQKKSTIRIFWFKIMYALTITVAGGLGIGMLLNPDITPWIFGIDCPRVFSGLIASVFLAFALISIIGLKNPIKLIPILFMQLLYKSIWLCFIAIPLLVTNKIPTDMIFVIAVFLVVIVGDLIAIPFRIIFNNTEEKMG
jgi:hypothetical protein